MKETIYTIPINEAFETKCNCAVCAIEHRIENEEVEYTLGAAMMEPDFRINTNHKGFCKSHYSRLMKHGKALPLALVLQTHIQQQNKDIFEGKIENVSKNNLFKKQCAEINSAKKITEYIENTEKNCVICERVQNTMNRYFNNLIYIWKTQPDFKAKFSGQEGFCIPHFSLLLKYAMDGLNDADFKEFYHSIIKIQKKSQEQQYEDISEFTRLFDHNNNSTPSENVKNSIKRTIQKISSLNCEID